MESLSKSQALIGLSVLLAIPILLFAIAAEYIKSSETEPSLKLRQTQGAGSFCMVFQWVTFFAFSDLRQSDPMLSLLVFGLAILSQSLLQAHLERTHLRARAQAKEILETSQRNSKSAPTVIETRSGPSGDSPDDLRIFFRTLASWSVMSAISLSAFVGCMMISAYLTRWAGPSAGLKSLIVIAGVGVGFLLLFGIQFFSAALHIRWVYRPSRLEGSDEGEKIKAWIQTAFKNARAKAPSIWILSENSPGIPAPLFIAPGLLHTPLFISESLFKKLHPQELCAVIFHELSHTLLGHFRKRLLLTLLHVTASTLFITCVALITRTWWIGLIGIVAAMMDLSKRVSQQNKHHELQADSHAVGVLGADLEAFCEALRKLDPARKQIHPTTRRGLGNVTHPATEFRIQLLKLKFPPKDFEATSSTALSKSDQDPSSWDQAA